MIVDSSATTARPSASAVATSGWIRTSGLGRGDRGHVRVEVGEHPVDDGLAQPQLRVAVRAGADLPDSAGLGDRRLLALLAGRPPLEVARFDRAGRVGNTGRGTASRRVGKTGVGTRRYTGSAK